MKLHGTMENINNSLHIGGISLEELAKEYKTPLYVIDEKLIRDNCREYVKHFVGENKKNKVAYAGKAFLPLYMCNIINEENLCLDVVSGGELYTAHKANFPMEKVLFHGNNKTIDEIELGIKLGVSVFVVDNFYEMQIINEICKRENKIQNIYLRITPGIEAHTHEYIKTGQIDSKFGFVVSNGDLDDAIGKVKTYENLNLIGIHAHIGSQIFDIEPYLDEVDIMLNLVKNIKENHDINITDVDLGGGFGVYYTDKDNPLDINVICENILTKASDVCKEINIEMPTMIIEPGRSIIANAGSTLYKVGSIKDIKDVRTYVSVDGGMTDNIRPSLYKAEYECFLVKDKVGKKKDKVTIAGKCCESGDILVTDVDIKNIKSEDLLIIASTGAYGYSMSSNYNKIPKAAVVSVYENTSKLICKRQTYDEMLSLEIL